MDRYAVVELLELMRITREQVEQVFQRQARSVWDMLESFPRALRSFLVYRAKARRRYERLE